MKEIKEADAWWFCALLSILTFADGTPQPTGPARTAESATDTIGSVFETA